VSEREREGGREGERRAKRRGGSQARKARGLKEESAEIPAQIGLALLPRIQQATEKPERAEREQRESRTGARRRDWNKKAPGSYSLSTVGAVP